MKWKHCDKKTTTRGVVVSLPSSFFFLNIQKFQNDLSNSFLQYSQKLVLLFIEKFISDEDSPGWRCTMSEDTVNVNTCRDEILYRRSLFELNWTQRRLLINHKEVQHVFC